MSLRVSSLKPFKCLCLSSVLIEIVQTEYTVVVLVVEKEMRAIHDEYIMNHLLVRLPEHLSRRQRNSVVDKFDLIPFITLTFL